MDYINTTTTPINGQEPNTQAPNRLGGQAAVLGQGQSAGVMPIGQGMRSNESFASASSTTPMELDPPRPKPASVLGRRRFASDDDDDEDDGNPASPEHPLSSGRGASYDAEARARSRSRHFDNQGDMSAARAFVETREARLLREEFMKATGRRQPRATRMRVRAWCCGCRAEQRFHSNCLCYGCGHERCNDCLLGGYDARAGKMGGV